MAESKGPSSFSPAHSPNLRSADEGKTTHYKSSTAPQPTEASNRNQNIPSGELVPGQEYQINFRNLQDARETEIYVPPVPLSTREPQVSQTRKMKQPHHRNQEQAHGFRVQDGLVNSRTEGTERNTRKEMEVGTMTSAKKQDWKHIQVTPAAISEQNQSSSDLRRAATRAFAAHAKIFAKEYNHTKPRSERQFIWSFLDGIPDPAWATYMQQQLLEAYPGSVHPSLGVRAKHLINFGEGLVWRDVVTLIRTMQQKTVPIHLDGK